MYTWSHIVQFVQDGIQIAVTVSSSGVQWVGYPFKGALAELSISAVGIGYIKYESTSYNVIPVCVKYIHDH